MSHELVTTVGQGARISLDDLRLLAASDPKQARIAFLAVLNGNCPELSSVLESISGPSDGRLRQMVATVYRTNNDATVLKEWLQKWQTLESDEFTQNAISTALATREPEDATALPTTSQPASMVASYRYVADRLCHRVRNTMARPSSQLMRLERIVKRIEDPAIKDELAQVLATLEQGFSRIARNVEFDTDDGYLAWDSYNIIEWLEKSASRFEAQFGKGSLRVACAPEVRRTTVRATPFLLDTVFGNLWSNAIQAVDADCVINFHCASDAESARLEIMSIDNGEGFDDRHIDAVFQQAFSTKSPRRGRGLLEIADAINRLQGDVHLSPDADGKSRIKICLPLERT